MLRYDLDKLGWYEFEHLCQTLLKHKLGIGIEAWGGTKDWGRDAYYEGQLTYPTTQQEEEGPFLFQCKFISGANSAGADYENLILTAVNAECKSIEKKLSNTKTETVRLLRKSEWDYPPQIYTFMSNAIIKPILRGKIEECIKTVLPDCKFVKQDGNDICSLIDLTTGIARKFPQILSLNDLNALLDNCVSKDILNRSDAALKEAEEISKVFVPTETYSKALNVLYKFHYLVLEGPPEVGKTAIGRMIALSYIPEGWEAIECKVPNDFLRKHDPSKKQIFVADDSFGRTEYKPDRVSLWQDDLPAILRKIDKQHFLILTSRKHLLEMAKDKLDIPGANQDFPLPAEVLVDVSILTRLEKTLMLYKHMKNAALTKPQKIFVRALAKKVIEHDGFTPERIRVLSQKAKTEKINIELIEETLKNPTDRMSKTYRELPIAHKWFMISVLLNPSSPVFMSEENAIATKNLYEILCPAEDMLDFNKVKSQLSESFIKTIRLSDPQERVLGEDITWIHPSCGDMVAMELSISPKDRTYFLDNCDVNGLKYAISVGGGYKGLEVLPLLKNPKDWKIFKARCNEVLDISLVNNIFDSVQRLSKSGKHQKEKQLLEHVLKENVVNVIEHFNKKGWSDNGLLTMLNNIKYCSGITLPVIKYGDTWLKCADSAIEILEGDYSEWHEYADIDIFLSLTKAIIAYEPHFLGDEDIKNKWRDVVNIFLERGEEESLTEVCDPEPDLVEELYDSYNGSEGLFKELSTIVKNTEQHKKLVEISTNFSLLSRNIAQYLPPEPDYERDDDDFYNSEDWSIEGIFRDL